MMYSRLQHSNPDRLEPGGARTTRELDSRTSDGVDVRLLWHSSENRVSVAVSDTKTGEAFELAVRQGQSPLDVFHHPFAYAGHGGAGIWSDLVPSTASRSS